MKDNKATTPLEAAMKKARDGVALARKEAEAGAARMSVFRLYLAADDLALIVEEVDRLRGSAVFASLLLAALEDPDVTPEDETRAALDLRRALGEPTDPLAALDVGARRARRGARRLRGDHRATAPRRKDRCLVTALVAKWSMRGRWHWCRGHRGPTLCGIARLRSVGECAVSAKNRREGCARCRRAKGGAS